MSLGLEGIWEKGKGEEWGWGGCKDGEGKIVWGSRKGGKAAEWLGEASG